MTEKQQYQKDKEWQQQMQLLKKIRNNTFKRNFTALIQAPLYDMVQTISIKNPDGTVTKHRYLMNTKYTRIINKRRK